MKKLGFFSRFISTMIAALAATALFSSMSSAEVPSYYTGVPYPLGSAPKKIPGRVNFHDYDKGGPLVSFKQDDMASGHWGGCCAGLRDTGALKDGDPDHPSFNLTNHFTSPSDTFYTAGVSFPNGVRYPSPDTSVAANDWYIGAAHPTDWFNVTVHVSKPGKYWISSIWAAMETSISFQIFFIGTQYAATSDTVRTPVVTLPGYNSYHAWRKYADFASIQLDSGVQVMKFYDLTYHINQDFLYFATDSGNFPTDVVRSSEKVTNSGQFDLSINRGAVRFTLPDAGMTRISVFNCLGREIVPVLEKSLSAGDHSVALNAASLKQGIYFLHIQSNGVNSVTRFQKIGK